MESQWLMSQVRHRRRLGVEAVPVVAHDARRRLWGRRRAFNGRRVWGFPLEQHLRRCEADQNRAAEGVMIYVEVCLRDERLAEMTLVVDACESADDRGAGRSGWFSNLANRYTYRFVVEIEVPISGPFR